MRVPNIEIQQSAHKINKTFEKGILRDEFKNNNWSKRYLPHYDADYKHQMITYRLADSIPQSLHKSPAGSFLGTPQDFAGKNLSEVKKRKITEEALDKGYGSCLLAIDEVAMVQLNNWKYFDSVKYELIAYVIMPNHVHILIKTKQDYPLSKIVWGWKTHVSKFINSRPELYDKFYEHFEKKEVFSFNTAPIERLRHHKPAKSCGVPGSQKPESCEVTGKRKQSVWHREYWDRFIRDENHFQSAIEYIHNNPVKAGLVKSQEEWKWSSASSTLKI